MPKVKEEGGWPRAMAKVIFAKLLLRQRETVRAKEREGEKVEQDSLVPAQLNTMQFKPAVN